MSKCLYCGQYIRFSGTYTWEDVEGAWQTDESKNKPLIIKAGKYEGDPSGFVCSERGHHDVHRDRLHVPEIDVVRKIIEFYEV